VAAHVAPEMQTRHGLRNAAKLLYTNDNPDGPNLEETQ
jgi:hypothetical protein